MCKPQEDKSYGEIIAHTPSVQIAKEQLPQLGGLNEVLAVQLNLLLGGRLRIPMALVAEGQSVHAFVDNRGTYWRCLDQDPNLNCKLDKNAAQQFVLMQMILGNTDCHGDNILIDRENCPIGIDFGRILFPDPLNKNGKLRGAFLRFPGLDELILNEESKAFYEQLDVVGTVDALRQVMQEQFPGMSTVIELELNQLQARLCMVQEGMKEGLTLRQMLALELPPLTIQEYKRLRATMRALTKKYCNQGYSEEAADKKAKAALRKPLQQHMNAYGFYKAWKEAMRTGMYNHEHFQQQIQQQIQDIKNKPPETLYTPKEIEMYRAAGYDASY